jgi:hypothetical protein
MPNQSDKIYIENSFVPGTRDYPLVASMGDHNRSRPYMRGENFQELISGTNKRGDSSYDLTAIDPNAQNQFLDIPSFMHYPQDLGRNQRYHHFMTFNIYQGTSDQTRLVQRQINQFTSAMLAKGDFGAGTNQRPDSKENVAGILTQAGFTQVQIDEFLKSFVGATGELRFRGITSDERRNFIEQIASGKIGNIADPDGNGGITDYVAAALQTTGDAVVDGYNLLKELTQASSRDNLDPSNQPKRNQSEVGVSGKKVNRSKSEQNILLANRRFNFANVKSKDTICLFMPLKFSVNDQLVYSEEEMGANKAALEGLMLKRGGLSALVEKAGTKAASDALEASLSGIALEGVNLQSVRNAATRSVSNPRREVMFKDVGIRQHTFSWDFFPSNSTEAQTVLNIIKLLRYHAYPGLRGGGGHFFTFPAEFEVTFNTITPEGVVRTNDNLPKLARLALQSINVDYAAAGDYKTFPDGKPAFIRMELQFQEMEQLTNEHIINGY